MICSNSPGLGWKPRGILVAHLAEHTSGVTRLASIPDTTLMASTSMDGTLRIWDVAKIESGKNNFAHRARQVYDRHVPLDGLAASSHNNILACAARDGSISVFNIEKQGMVASEETWLAAGTSSGVVSVWDLRFRLQVMHINSLV